MTIKIKKYIFFLQFNDYIQNINFKDVKSVRLLIPNYLMYKSLKSLLVLHS